MPGADAQVFPLADGGEGTAEVLNWHLGGKLVEVAVNDPLFRPVGAHYFSQKLPGCRNAGNFRNLYELGVEMCR